MLDERKAAVLGALIEEYISCGEPVSSTTVLEVSGLSVSAATIRNDLAYLEREGFAVQPHTSAGRVPTGQGYRWYVDHTEAGRIRAPTKVRIQDFFSTVQLELGRLLKATSDLVSEVTTYPAIITGPGLRGDTLRGIHLVQLGARSVLVVLVTDQGRVTQEVIHLEHEAGQESIDTAAATLANLLVGEPIDDLDAGLAALPADPSRAVTAIINAGIEVLRRSQEATRELYIGGTSRMASIWEDLQSVHRVLEVLERESMVLSMVSSIQPGTTIQIGDEIPVEGAADLAMVSASYEVGDTGGTIGVLGPMRMDYRRTISIVEEVRDKLADRLGS